MELAEFLTARLDEDELTAREANTSPEMVTGIPRSYAKAPIAIHIARHDPGRVLLEVESKRLFLADHEGVHRCDWGEHRGDETFGYCTTLKRLALPYADHEDYDKAWHPDA